MLTRVLVLALALTSYLCAPAVGFEDPMQLEIEMELDSEGEAEPRFLATSSHTHSAFENMARLLRLSVARTKGAVHAAHDERSGREAEFEQHSIGRWLRLVRARLSRGDQPA